MNRCRESQCSPAKQPAAAARPGSRALLTPAPVGPPALPTPGTRGLGAAAPPPHFWPGRGRPRTRTGRKSRPSHPAPQQDLQADPLLAAGPARTAMLNYSGIKTLGFFLQKRNCAVQCVLRVRQERTGRDGTGACGPRRGPRAALRAQHPRRRGARGSSARPDAGGSGRSARPSPGLQPAPPRFNPGVRQGAQCLSPSRRPAAFSSRDA